VAEIRLAFHDLDRLDPSMTARLMTEVEARAVVEMLRCALEETAPQRVMVHCEAGISRSAGVAAALSRAVNGDDADFFARRLPNRLCYRLVLEAAAELDLL
jgi:protein-tyrosine phosphatase